MATTTTGSTPNNVPQYGTTGDDKMVGGSGVDILNGGAGNDFINGGSGNDILNGGSGFDTVLGGQGADILIYKAYENEYVLGGTWNATTLTVSGGTKYIGTDQTDAQAATGAFTPASVLVAPSFTGSDSYDGGNGSAGDVDTLQIWLSAQQLNDAAIMAEITYYNTVWLPAHQKNNQADNTVYTFKTMNLQASNFERLEVHDSTGVKVIIVDANKDVAAVAEDSTVSADASHGVLANDYDVNGYALQVSSIASGSNSQPVNANNSPRRSALPTER